MQRHQKHHRLARYIGRRPRRFPLFACPRTNQDLVRYISLRGGDSREQRPAQGARHAWEDGHAGSETTGLEEEYLLATAAVDVWIALLEAQDCLAGLEAGKSGFEEFLLGEVSVAGEFARNVDGGVARDEVQNWRGHELIREDKISCVDGLEGRAGEEIGMAGAGASEDESPEGVVLGGRRRGWHVEFVGLVALRGRVSS